MSKPRRKPSIKPPTADEDRRIRSGAKQDADAPPLTARQLKSMMPLKAARGRPRADRPKVLVSVRYSQEVIDYFRSTGEGWQSRMDEVLRRYVARHQKAEAVQQRTPR